jgi:hypothetical protein
VVSGDKKKMQRVISKNYVSNWKALNLSLNKETVYHIREEDIHVSLVNPLQPPTFQNLYYWVFFSLSEKVRRLQYSPTKSGNVISVRIKGEHWQFVHLPPKKTDIWPIGEYDYQNPPVLIEYDHKRVFSTDLTLDELEPHKPYAVNLDDLLFDEARSQYLVYCPQFFHLAKESPSQISVIKETQNGESKLLTPDLWKIAQFGQKTGIVSISPHWSFHPACIRLESDCPRWVGLCLEKINQVCRIVEAMFADIGHETTVTCFVLEYVFQPLISMESLFCNEQREVFIDGDMAVVELSMHEWRKDHTKETLLRCSLKYCRRTKSPFFCVQIPKGCQFAIEARENSSIRLTAAQEGERDYPVWLAFGE